MKTIRPSIRIVPAVLGFGALLTTAVAGPGPQYWQERAQAAAVPVVNAAAAAPKDQACPFCKTTKVEQFSATNTSGKLAPHFTVVGTKHECTGCGVSATAMTSSCPGQVATTAAKPSCCPKSS